MQLTNMYKKHDNFSHLSQNREKGFCYMHEKWGENSKTHHFKWFDLSYHEK